MTRIIICGCNGKMGREVSACAALRADCRVVGGIDMNTEVKCDYPVFTKPADIDVAADVIIDFSNPALLPSLLQYAQIHKTPLVLCTTGYNTAQIEALTRVSKEVPVFYSGNMSLGINLLIELSKKAAKVLGNGFDIEIVEKHHNQKIDAPSGTALMIADGISSVMNENVHYVYDRHSQRKKRESTEIGIHSIRGGTIVGEHEVIFAGHHEVITLAHSAQSKEVFAVGAINAGIYLAKMSAGLYNMSDLLK
ncbi:4-hydroxy-tetrahydrodipicolinate reductase [Caproiciproducens faecalis]|uniref:4-hydroxy-tetrahydrodipicolinate reductase n=1 Tax=Caproiciproducens faecalis TaxID=2820301 RepID=A0ABS7DRM9_9FIRM|nr:4-hydroxy-tetrahydrodipicolinate reductase [Caproiciproducens faecalis]MBW7573756.1 4-hydroxy-tetrahydrodipicolinate reductase [Caproiciproducens faecalis]